MTRWGMVIDLDACSGCQACLVACSQESNVPPGSPEDAASGRLIRWLQVLPQVEGEEYPHLSAHLSPMMCQHCGHPPCTYVCPVNATYSTSDGTVAQIYWRCIGCRYCVNACPYTMKWFNWWTPGWTSDNVRGTNPDVALREKGITEKCLFCHHRLQRVKERAREEGRPIAAGEYQPACVEACPTGAMVFGDLDDPESEVSRLSRSPAVFRFLEELGTDPHVYYLKAR